MTVFTQQMAPARNWVDATERIREVVVEVDKNFSYMTEFERRQGVELIYRAREFYRPIVERGVCDEFRAAVKNYESAQNRVALEQAREIVSWEPGKLGDEMRVISARIDVALSGVNPVAELQALREEADLSGDKYKKRAVLELTRGALGKAKGADPDVRMAINRIAQESDRELKELRVSEGMRAAWAEGQAAFDSLMQAHKQLDSAARTLGDLTGDQGPYRGEIGKQYARIQTGTNGEMTIKPEK